jgi:hypothetical protein
MRATLLSSAAAVLFLAAAAPYAHHSGYVYQATPLWISGTVVDLERIDPHTIIRVEERREDGSVRRWAVEGPGRSQLARGGNDARVPQVGETLELCVFPYKAREELARTFPEIANGPSATADASESPQLVAGHVWVANDGEKQFWEPHGFLSECIRSSDDSRQSWIEFLEANPRVLDAWCEQTAYEHVRSTASLQELITEVNAALDRRC